MPDADPDREAVASVAVSRFDAFLAGAPARSGERARLHELLSEIGIYGAAGVGLVGRIVSSLTYLGSAERLGRMRVVGRLLADPGNIRR